MDDEIRRKILALLDQHRIMTVATPRADHVGPTALALIELVARRELDLARAAQVTSPLIVRCQATAPRAGARPSVHSGVARGLFPRTG